MREIASTRSATASAHVLAQVIDPQQSDSALQHGGHRLTDGPTQLLGDMPGYRCRRRIEHHNGITSGELENTDAIRKFIRQTGRELLRQPVLPARDTGQRHEPMCANAGSYASTSDSRPMKLVV